MIQHSQFMDYIQAIRMLNFDWKCKRSEKLTAVCVACVRPVYVCVCLCWLAKRIVCTHVGLSCQHQNEYKHRTTAEQMRMASMCACALHRCMTFRTILMCLCVCAFCVSFVIVKGSKHVMRYMTHSSDRDKMYILDRVDESERARMCVS